MMIRAFRCVRVFASCALFDLWLVRCSSILFDSTVEGYSQLRCFDWLQCLYDSAHTLSAAVGCCAGDSGGGLRRLSQIGILSLPSYNKKFQRYTRIMDEKVEKKKKTNYMNKKNIQQRKY